jgi:hypothetical protein
MENKSLWDDKIEWFKVRKAIIFVSCSAATVWALLKKGERKKRNLGGYFPHKCENPIIAMCVQPYVVQKKKWARVTVGCGTLQIMTLFYSDKFCWKGFHIMLIECTRVRITWLNGLRIFLLLFSIAPTVLSCNLARSCRMKSQKIEKVQQTFSSLIS